MCARPPLSNRNLRTCRQGQSVQIGLNKHWVCQCRTHRRDEPLKFKQICNSKTHMRRGEVKCKHILTVAFGLTPHGPEASSYRNPWPATTQARAKADKHTQRAPHILPKRGRHVYRTIHICAQHVSRLIPDSLAVFSAGLCFCECCTEILATRKVAHTSASSARVLARLCEAQAPACRSPPNRYPSRSAHRSRSRSPSRSPPARCRSRGPHRARPTAQRLPPRQATTQGVAH